MSETHTKYSRSSKFIRLFRRIHRQIAIVLFVFFLIVSISGLMLGWKKNSFGLIQPKNSKGTSTTIADWLPLDSLTSIAIETLHGSVSPTLATTLDRIDARPDKGMVKFVFDDDYWEVQLDAKTGNVLQIDQRRSDIIEHIHDGTILDVLFDTKNEQFKLSYTTTMGTALLLLVITGGWLWFGPKKLRRDKQAGLPQKRRAFF